MSEIITDGEGLDDPGILDPGHDYCEALVYGWFGPTYGDPQFDAEADGHDNERLTVAGVIAAAAKEAA